MTGRLSETRRPLGRPLNGWSSSPPVGGARSP